MPRRRARNSSPRLPSLALLWSLVLVAVACTGGGSAPAAKKVTAQAVELKDHILSMDVSSSIDSKGQPVDPSFTFDPTAKQITVLAQVGDLTGDPPLVFTWSQSTSGGDKELFSQTVKVNNLDVAFSVGKSPGTLALGTYKITATLSGETKSTEAIVNVAPPSSSTSSASSAASSSGDPQPAKAGPPVSGQSGVVPQASAATTAGTGTAAISSDDRPLELNTQDQVTWSYIVTSSKAVSYTSDFTLQVNGGPKVGIGHTEGNTVLIPGATQGQPGGFDQQEWGFDPCIGGSDLPGSTIVVSDQTHSSAGQTSHSFGPVVLGPDTMSPIVTTTANPPSDTKVKPGDQITFDVTAVEARGPGLPWQTGVKLIGLGLTTPTGAGTPVGVEAPVTFGDKALPCDQKSWRQTATLTYTVPANPPPIVSLLTYSQDWNSNGVGQVFNYPTAETWTGTMSLAGFTNVGGDVCTQPPVDFTISFTSASDGTVKGKGRFHGPPYTCVTQFGSAPSPPSKGTITIDGRRTGNQLSLVLNAVKGGAGWFAPFWPNPHLQWTVPIQGTQAHTVITGQGMGVSPGHVTLTVDLTCSGCTTGAA